MSRTCRVETPVDNNPLESMVAARHKLSPLGTGYSKKYNDLRNLLVAGELGFEPRLASLIKNHWPAALSCPSPAVVSAHCGPYLWTIQAAAGPKPPRWLGPARELHLTELVDDRAVLMSRSGDPSGAARERPICLPTTASPNTTRYLSSARNYCVYVWRDPRCPTLE
jgi:hypothetical protein